MSTESNRADPAIEAVGVARSFGDVVAVDGIGLAVAEGEWFSLLGPTTRAPRRRCGTLLDGKRTRPGRWMAGPAPTSTPPTTA